MFQLGTGELVKTVHCVCVCVYVCVCVCVCAIVRACVCVCILVLALITCLPLQKDIKAAKLESIEAKPNKKEPLWTDY